MSQLSRTAWKALYGSTGSVFPDNTTGEISEGDMRTFGENASDSFFQKSDDSYTAPFPQVTASGTDTYTATLSPAITAYAAGQKFQILFTNANTGAATLNLNSVGALAITKNGATALAAGDIPAGGIKILAYDGTRLQIVGDGGGGGTAATTSFTPAGSIAATDVQAALEELDSEKIGSSSVVGVQDLFIPASYMTPTITDGCSFLTQSEMATSLVNILTLDFDQTTEEHAQFQIVLPRKWNNLTITFVPYWTASAGTPGQTVRWKMSGGSYSNDVALTTTTGAAYAVDDTLLATNDLHIGDESPAMTISNTPGSMDFLILQIHREVSSDDLAADAKLLGVSLRITTTAAKDA